MESKERTAFQFPFKLLQLINNKSLLHAPLIVHGIFHIFQSCDQHLPGSSLLPNSKKALGTRLCGTQNMHARPTLLGLTFITFCLILSYLIVILYGVYLYIFYRIYQTQALSATLSIASLISLLQLIELFMYFNH